MIKKKAKQKLVEVYLNPIDLEKFKDLKKIATIKGMTVNDPDVFRILLWNKLGRHKGKGLMRTRDKYLYTKFYPEQSSYRRGAKSVKKIAVFLNDEEYKAVHGLAISYEYQITHGEVFRILMDNRRIRGLDYPLKPYWDKKRKPRIKKEGIMDPDLMK